VTLLSAYHVGGGGAKTSQDDGRADESKIHQQQLSRTTADLIDNAGCRFRTKKQLARTIPVLLAPSTTQRV